MSAELSPNTPSVFGYFLNICSLLHFGYFSDAEKSLTEFLEDKNRLNQLPGLDRTYAIDTATIMRSWICAKQDTKNPPNKD